MNTIGPRMLAVTFGLLFVTSTLCYAGKLDEHTVRQLKREVDERERQLTRVERELADARARLALAQGNREMAIRELRKVVRYCKAEVQWIRDHVNWFCDPGEPMQDAQWELAKAEAQLAELQGDHATLVDARKRIVGFHEMRFARVERLEKMQAVKPEEIIAVRQALDDARKSLQVAEKQLSAAQQP